MSELNYQLLTKEEAHSYQAVRNRQKNPLKRIIQRYTLPEPTDAIGRKKELLEKIEILICLIIGIGIIVWIFTSNNESFPQWTRTVISKKEPHEFPLPVYGLCFPLATFQGWSPVVWRVRQRKSFQSNETSTCEHWSPAGVRTFLATPSWRINELFRTPEQTFSCTNDLESSCADIITMDYDRQCVAIGSSNCSLWTKLWHNEVFEVQLLAFWSRINEFPTTTPGGWYDSARDFLNDPRSYRTEVLLGGVTQAILEFKREDLNFPDPEDALGWKFRTNTSYPTSITTLNLLDNHFTCRNGSDTYLVANRMCYTLQPPNRPPVFAAPTSFSVLELQIRLPSTEILTTTIERRWDFLYRSVKDIGGFLGVVFTLVTFVISKLATRLIFSEQDAFFDTQTRLAVTHFLNEKRTSSEE